MNTNRSTDAAARASRADITLMSEWLSDGWRMCDVRIAPCPRFHAEHYYKHSLTVADCFDDELAHVYCTCGWVGPGFETEQQAVEHHNRPHGFGIEMVGEWSERVPPPVAGESADLPF